MIERSFIFLPGIGPRSEINLWMQGITNWNDFLRTKKIRGLSDHKKALCDRIIISAKKALLKEDSAFFASLLPKSEHWRLYNYFGDEAVFLDIETCGGYGYITVIGLYDGFEVKQMIRGANMYKDLLKEELSKYKMIITFNGSSFDLPIINRYFREIVPNIPHLDLRHLCSRIGLNGGLKMIEKELGINRGEEVDGMCGGDAVLLWDKFTVTQDEKYLNQLLQYNAEDILNLKPLARFAVNEMQKKIQTSLKVF